MKRNIYTLIALTCLLLVGCAHEFQTERILNYSPPILKEQPKFFYPTLAQEKSINGKTKVVIKISKEGNVYGVVVIKSAGEKILDRAVIDYCNSLSFIAATQNGEPIESRYIWEFNFDFADYKYSIKKYLDTVGDLTELANKAVSNERMSILRDILKLHNEFVKNTSDALNFNTVVGKVISSSLAMEWKNDWNTYPLSFLIYHDFMVRFADYDSLADVKLMLQNSLKNDLKYIGSVKTSDVNSQVQKNKLLEKIKKFISEKYPALVKNKKQKLIVAGKY